MLNPFIESGFTSVIHSVIGSGVIVAGILLIRKLAMGKITRKLQYSLWVILPVYLLLSPFFSIDVPVHSTPSDIFADIIKENAAQATGTATRQIAPPDGQDTVLPSPIGDAYETLPPVSYINNGLTENNHTAMQDLNQEIPVTLTPFNVNRLWNAIRLFVSFLLFAFFAISNIIFAILLAKKRKFYKKDKRTNLNIYFVHNPNAPFLFGRSIYLPPAAPGKPEQMRYMVLHEFCHFKQGDLFWNFLKYVCLALYWFHPFVWIAAHYISRDCELACDEAVIRIVGTKNQKEYGLTLLQLIREKQRNTSFTIGTTMKGRKSMIKERIQLLSKPFSMNRQGTLACLTGLFLLTGCALVRPYASDQTADAHESNQLMTEIVSKEDDQTINENTTPETLDISAQNPEMLPSGAGNNHYYNPIKYADGILYYQTAEGLQSMDMKTGEITYLVYGKIHFGFISDHFLYYIKSPTSSYNEDGASSNENSTLGDEAGVYRLDLTSQTESLLIPWTDDLWGCSSMLVRNDCLYLEMDKFCQAYLLKDGQATILDEPDNQIQHAINLFDMTTDNGYRMNFEFIHSISEYSTFTLIDSQNHKLYICNTQSQEIIEKENCLGDVIVCDAGIIYQTPDFNIILNPWTNLEENRLLFSSEKAGYVLNYGTCNNTGLFAFRENGDSAECKYITWDGNMQDFIQIPDVRLSIDLHFSAFSDFAAYYNDGNIYMKELTDL